MILSHRMKLVDEAGNDVEIGQEITNFRGEKAIVTGGQAPRTPDSTGRVTVTSAKPDEDWQMAYYPSVYNLRWVEA
jgi:hypothetical protein